MKFPKVLILVLICLSSACAVTNGTPYTTNFCSSAGTGVATFYQEPGFVGGGLRPLLKVDGIEIAPIPKGGFVSVRMAEGEHQFEVVDNKNDMAAWSRSEDLKANFNIKEGEEKWLKFSVRSWSPAIPIPVGAALIPAGGSRHSAVIDIPYQQVSEMIEGLEGSFYLLSDTAVELNPVTCLRVDLDE